MIDHRVERAVREFQRLAVHDPRFDGEAQPGCAALEPGEHGRGDVGSRDSDAFWDEIQVQPGSGAHQQDAFAGLEIEQLNRLAAPGMGGRGEQI